MTFCDELPVLAPRCISPRLGNILPLFTLRAKSARRLRASEGAGTPTATSSLFLWPSELTRFPLTLFFTGSDMSCWSACLTISLGEKLSKVLQPVKTKENKKKQTQQIVKKQPGKRHKKGRICHRHKHTCKTNSRNCTEATVAFPTEIVKLV